jgi:hypothetical protein
LVGWVLTGVIFILLIGSWPYVRNWVEYNNPAYPFHVDFLGKRVFKGERKLEGLEAPHLLGEFYARMKKRSPLGKVYLSWSEPGTQCTYDSRVGGFGSTLFVLLIPCFGAALLVSLLRRDGCMFFTLVTFLVAFWLTPVGRFWVRYNIFVVAMFTISLAYILDMLRGSRAAHLLKAVTLLLVLMSILLGARNEMVPPRQIKYYLSAPTRLWHSSQHTVQGFEKSVFRKIYELAKPGTSIAYDHGFKYKFMYPLWNRDFSNKVYFVLNEKENAWENSIDAYGVDFLITGVESNSYKWARAKPEKFQLIIRGNHLSLFEITKGKPLDVEVDDEKEMD